ncbi:MULTISPECIES: hypothetical protein [Actinomadura]|uniref:Uncharacterized protein n=1 Tax=Actinomadura yumaensis TaxID=111807 RepID=A0ABW2CSX1_9ACTN|nr:hypothetical protein [Actinomadura sp. J1-007]MWK35308.1 hypothetical protein [Actinomadura sp. J1-007]
MLDAWWDVSASLRSARCDGARLGGVEHEAAEDAARVIGYLASPLASQVTGAERTDDGGTLPHL